MSMSDPIADMLARIRNALSARHSSARIPHSVLKGEIAAILKEKGYIEDFKIIRSKPRPTILIRLKYHDGAPAIRGLKRLSRPGLRDYRSASDLPRVLNGLGSAIISTSQGVLSDDEARAANVGGEALCVVW